MADAVEMAVRSNAPRLRQCSEKILYPGHRRQIELEGGSRAGGECLEKCVWQCSSELGRDRSRESGAVLAEAEGDSFVDRRRKIDRDQALGENTGKDQLAVDQDTITIENEKIGHAVSFALGLQFAAYMTADIVICHPVEEQRDATVLRESRIPVRRSAVSRSLRSRGTGRLYRRRICVTLRLPGGGVAQPIECQRLHPGADQQPG